MVKFGKFLKSVKQTKWGKQYFNYKALKDLLKDPGDPEDSQTVTIRFFSQMDQELNKVLNFVWPTTIDLKTSLAGLSSQLPAQIETLVTGSDIDSANEYAKRVLVHAKDARELVLFMDVNLIAIHKVMKKFNKKMKSQAAHEYVQAKCGSELEKLWDLSVLPT